MRRLFLTVNNSSINVGGKLLPKSTTPYAVTVSELEYKSLQSHAAGGAVTITANNNPDVETVIASTAAPGSGIFDTENSETPIVSIHGTATSIAYSFWGSVDGGTNWFKLAAQNLSEGIGTYYNSGTTLNTGWVFLPLGIDKIKIVIDSISGGTAYVIVGKYPELSKEA